MTDNKKIEGFFEAKQPDTTILVKGQIFACKCGCNVFSPRSQTVYMCKNCNKLFEGKKI